MRRIPLGRFPSMGPAPVSWKSSAIETGFKFSLRLGRVIGSISRPRGRRRNLRLHNSSGALVAENDDIDLGVNRDSQLTFTPNATGTYYLEAGSFVDSYTGTYKVSVTGPTVIGPHQPASTDFNADGHSDFLWQNNNGTPAAWTINGLTATGGLRSSIPAQAGTKRRRRLQRRRQADILWQNNDGTPAVWLMDGLAPVGGATLFNPGPTWHTIAAGDFNGDGKADVLWQNNDGTPAVWLMDGLGPVGGATFFNPGPTWHTIAAGDFNGDGRADILWQNNDGTPAVWLMNGLTPIGGATLFNPGATWHVIDAADYNGDGKADVEWQNNDGTPAVWLMNGLTPVAGATLFNPGADWHLIG